ncbi:PREDICTED: uncharacterized protein LOC105457554 [Wasmannia auropunctata]|uniref:uncharacterized protein LOC105457554 n=1 Tax=Wasmannia auropunctata TaxID=64793 RepID=UPI0005EE43A5|nr:PREDICTED: uncharacterized protein LOC105457554 [Wasmannia auropunctata]XP_011700578.1 PREDICTED: uncharacterized protein LOC105457554 [Wasmannia auropunctata]
MLSKWLLVSLLALSIQKISAANYFDATKFNELKELNSRFALPGVTDALENIASPFAGNRGLKCECEENHRSCSCCNTVNITKLNINHHACTKVSFSPETLSASLKLIVNGKELFSTGLSGENPPPFCVPIAPPLSFCVRAYNISISRRSFHTCINLEAHFLKWTLLTLNFNCVKMGADGISWMKPGEYVPDTAVLTMTDPEMNEPEIFDHVDFEPDSTDLPTNPSLTPEEESNIGQLKV